MTIWRMRFAFWIPKATDTHSDCFSIAEMIARTRLIAALYTHGLSCSSFSKLRRHEIAFSVGGGGRR